VLLTNQNNQSVNAKIIKNQENQYMKYAGAGNNKNAILNTAYKGQKTVQTHVIHAAVSTSTNDMPKILNSMPSIDFS
jgi:hypothetical protein